MIYYVITTEEIVTPCEIVKIGLSDADANSHGIVVTMYRFSAVGSPVSIDSIPLKAKSRIDSYKYDSGACRRVSDQNPRMILGYGQDGSVESARGVDYRTGDFV